LLSSLDDLLARISAALRHLPGAQELYLFGSAADPALKDPYSDLDLRVISTQFELSRAAWPAVLSRAGEMALVFQLDPASPDARETAFTLGFAGRSPYHKVDFGLAEQGLAGGFFGQVQAKRLLWRQEASATPVDGAPGEAWRPAWGSPDHFLLGELLGSVRYVKARKRRQHLACWRFLSAKFNALLRCYRWEPGCPVLPGAAMTTWDYTALDRQLPEEQRLGLLSGLQAGSPAEMDRSLLALTLQIAGRVMPGYVTATTREARLVRAYLNFIERELAD